MIGSVGAVFRFEWKRALTLPRMAWWLALAAFPVFIVGLIRYTARNDVPREVWAGILFALVPMLISMLGTLLWTTPAISAELERRSWVYLAIRPNGGIAVMLGKYLAAVTWVVPAAILGLSIAVPLAKADDSWNLWWTMTRLVCLSCPAYSAIYLFLGILMPRRGMVLAVAYSLVFELMISFIPAVINKLTVQYRLRALLVEWCHLPISKDKLAALFGDAPAWQHIAVLAFVVPSLLALSVAMLRWSEFASSAETDV